MRLDKWFVGMWAARHCKNGISSYELAKALGVTQKTGWFMLQRIRLAMQRGTFEKLGGSGPVEADETSSVAKRVTCTSGSVREDQRYWRQRKELVMGLLDVRRARCM